MTKFSINTGLFGSHIDTENWEYEFDCISGSFGVDPDYPTFIIGGDNYLHFAGLELFDRHEDAKKGRRIAIFGDEVIVTDDLTGNPSRRRGGISLYFHSENGTPVKMNVVQHKGQTEVNFEVWDGEKPAI